MNNIHIYAPKTFAARRIMHCKTCRTTRRVVQKLGFDLCVLFCCGCGGDPNSRSRFKKITWERQRRINKARQAWSRANDFKTAAKLAAQEAIDMFVP